MKLYEREEMETSRIPELENMIADCERRRGNLIKALEEGIAPSDIKKRIDEIEEEKLTFRSELARIKTETPLLNKQSVIL